MPVLPVMEIIPVLSYLCLISAFVTYSLGIIVLAKNSSHPINRLFCIVMTAAAYWALGEYLIWQSENFASAWFWLKFSSFWTVVIVLTIHFILTYTHHPLSDRKQIPFLIMALYVPAVSFSLVEILTDGLFVIKYQPGTGFYYTPVMEGPIYIIGTVFFIVIIVWGIGIAALSWRKAQTRKKRKQSLLLTIGFLLVLVLGGMSVLVLPALQVHTPNLVFIGVVIFSVIVSYGIVKYGLFTISPENAATNIIKTMPDGLILSDMNGVILIINEQGAGIFGEEKRGLIGRSIDQILPGRTCQDITQKIHQSEIFSDLEVFIPGMQTRAISIAGSPIRDPEGNPAGIILIVRDISSRKESERALELANKKNSLVARLTRHDISNLVTPLYGYLSLLNEEERILPHDPQLVLCLNLVERIIQQLQFLQNYQEIGVQKPEWISLEALISGALAVFSPGEIRVTSLICNAEIYADPLIGKVIYNILDNSVRHGRKVSQITIQPAIHRNGDLSIRIQDDGIGIKNEEKERIFEYGYGKNTGLGLAISREILSITGISLVEEGIYGRGACFTLHIPEQIVRIIGDT
jgi:PAS domain S-box-containing protein